MGKLEVKLTLEYIALGLYLVCVVSSNGVKEPIDMLIVEELIDAL